MIRTFTLNDVVRYIYEEIKPEEKTEFESALIRDNELMEFYLETLETTGSLQKLRREPSDRVVDNILSYSRSFVLKSA